MKLIYANPNPIPSADPPSLQVVLTVSAMASSTEVHLIAQRGPSIQGYDEAAARDAVSAYYGIDLPESLHLHLLSGFDRRVCGIRLFWNFPFIARVAAAITRITRSGGAYAVLVRNLKLADFLLRYRRLLKLPLVIYESHEVFALSYLDEEQRTGRRNPRKAARLESLERRVYQQSDGLVCITSHLAGMIRDRYAADTPMTMAPDGVSLDNLSSTSSRSKQPNQSPIVLYLGSLHHWKGIDVLLAAISQLPGVRARIVGGNDESVARYRSRAGELGIGDRVSFEGYVLPARRFDFMADADVFVLPLMPISIASYFTSPIKLFEYMAAGRPIVASDLPAVREVLEDGVNALLVKPGAPDALAEGIGRVLENPALGECLAAKAAVDVRRYTWAARARSIIEFAGRIRTPS